MCRPHKAYTSHKTFYDVLTLCRSIDSSMAEHNICEVKKELKFIRQKLSNEVAIQLEQVKFKFWVTSVTATLEFSIKFGQSGTHVYALQTLNAGQQAVVACCLSCLNVELMDLLSRVNRFIWNFLDVKYLFQFRECHAGRVMCLRRQLELNTHRTDELTSYLQSIYCGFGLCEITLRNQLVGTQSILANFLIISFNYAHAVQLTRSRAIKIMYQCWIRGALSPKKKQRKTWFRPKRCFFASRDFASGVTLAQSVSGYSTKLVVYEWTMAQY